MKISNFTEFYTRQFIFWAVKSHRFHLEKCLATLKECQCMMRKKYYRKFGTFTRWSWWWWWWSRENWIFFHVDFRLFCFLDFCRWRWWETISNFSFFKYTNIFLLQFFNINLNCDWNQPTEMGKFSKLSCLFLILPETKFNLKIKILCCFFFRVK